MATRKTAFVFAGGGRLGAVQVGSCLISSVGLALIGPGYLGAKALWPLVNPTVVALPARDSRRCGR